MEAAAWPRPLFTPGGTALALSYVVYARAPLRFSLTLGAEGSPRAGLPPGLGIQRFEREEAPEFAEWADDLVSWPDVPDLGALAAASCWYEVGGRTPDGPDLSAIQAAWAVVRVLCRAGGLAVWDALAMRWSTAAEVLAADPAHPALAAAWAVEEGEVEGDAAGTSDGSPVVMVHTLGLPKFGRADLLAFGSPRNLPLLRQLVQGLALDLVEGAVLPPGVAVEKGGLRMRAELYVPGENGPPVPVPFFAQPILLVPVD